MNAIAPYVGPVLGLLGTLLVAFVGFYQWKKQHSNPNRSSVADTRRRAAEAVWSKLEEINVAVRENSAPGGGNLMSLHKEANLVFLKNSLYLEDKTQVLVRAYIDSLLQVSSMLSEEDTNNSEEWARTDIQSIAHDDLEVAASLAEVAKHREIVKNALLKATGA